MTNTRQTGDTLRGFRICRIRRLEELGGRLWELEHEKTGAGLCWLERPDENKTFSIAFKTLPEDSTGVFHILEHSVLCGSDKYPVKEPFVELLKSSVQTFLNAVTFPDKTVYPVSSRNDQDLLNLMDVYLDAVFHPAIYHKPEIFRQEGWRYEGKGEALCYQGVVFNEMKGAFASAGRVLEMEMERRLLPDTCYRHVSGGDPACIPDLTYEQFLAFHRKYYHPSNARICLAGSLDLETVLGRIDGYLSAFDRQEADFPIPMQQPVPRQECTVSYEIADGEQEQERTILCCGTLLGVYDELVRTDAASVLADYLTGDDDAPLKRAVLDQGLAQDFSITIHDGTQQSWISWEAWNSEAEHLPRLRQTLREILTRICEQGLDRRRLSACFHRYAFQLRDRESGDAPRSLSEAIQMLDTWLYGGDPAQGLLVEPSLQELEGKLDSGYFEDLIRELFLDNDHTVTVVLTPSATLGEERKQQEARRLARARAQWTQADHLRQQQQAEALRLWQQTPDSQEALASIPMLRLSDLRPRPETPVSREDNREGVPVLRHNLGAGLAYLRAYFLATDLTPEELPGLTILCRLLGSLATEGCSRSLLPLRIKDTMGSLEFAPQILAGSTPDRCRVSLCAGVACLSPRAEEAFSLLGEILTRTRWDDLPLLRDVLQQMNLATQLSLPSSGHQFALTRVAGNLTAHGLAREYTGGLEYARRIKDLAGAEDARLEALLAELRDLAKRLFSRPRMTISVSESVPEAALTRLLSAIPDGAPAAPEAVYAPAGARREGVEIPAAVGFAVTGTNLRLHGKPYAGSLPVLANVLNYVYLWSEIRVQGGAYGCGFGGRSDGDLFFYTYRDPQPGRSLEVIRRAADFVREFCADNPDLTGFILSAVSFLDPLMSAPTKMAVADRRRFAGVTPEDICRWYGELLHTAPADLTALCDALEAVFADGCVCVVAGKEQLSACAEERLQPVRL